MRIHTQRDHTRTLKILQSILEEFDGLWKHLNNQRVQKTYVQHARTYTHESTSWDLYTRENLSGHKLVVKRVSGTIDTVAAGSYTVTTRAIQHYDG